MTKIVFGEGRIKVNTGKQDGVHCLTMQRQKKKRPVGAVLDEPESVNPESDFDVVITFKNLQGARLLQDMLNEVVCTMAREAAPKVS